MVTWYVDITSLWTRSAEQLTSFTPNFSTLRKVAHNQDLSLLLTSLCQNKFSLKNFYVSILERFGKFTSLQKEKYSKSWFWKDLVKIQQPASSQQPISIYPPAPQQQQAVSQEQPPTIPQAVFQQQPAISQPQLVSIQQQSNNKQLQYSSSPAGSSFNTAAVQQQAASVQQQSSRK